MRRMLESTLTVALLLAVVLAASTARAVTVTDLGTFSGPGPGPGQLSGPNGIAAADDGTIYVADTYNYRVQHFTAAGALLGSFGGNGSGPGQFQFPYGIDVNAAGEIFVGDLSRRDVQVFSAAGSFLRSFGAGILNQPFGLWVSDGGIVFVTDRAAGVVRRFTVAGAYLGAFGSGLGANSLAFPQNAEGDGAGTVYISDGSGSQRMKAFTEAGGYLDTFGSWITNPTGAALANGQMYLTEYSANRVDVVDLATRGLVDIMGDDEPYTFGTPFDAATVGDSLLYVLEAAAARVHRFRVTTGPPPPPPPAPSVLVLAPNGGEHYVIGTGVQLRWSVTLPEHVVSADLWISRDAGASFESIAAGVANSGSYLWTATAPVSDRCRLRVVIHDDASRTFSDTSDSSWTLLAASPPAYPITLGTTFGGPGSLDGQLGGPDGIATSNDGFVYVADTYNSRVQKFTATGAHVLTFGTLGNGPGQFQRPYGIDVDAQGNVYVSDFGNLLVQKFSSAGQYLGRIGAAIAFSQPLGLWVSDAGILYVTDRTAAVVRVFNADTGEQISVWGPNIGEVFLSFPQNIEGDGCGLFYISDGSTAFRVREVDGGGRHVESFGSPWIGNPTGAALAGSHMFLTEYNLNRFSVVVLLNNSQADIWGDAGDPITFNSPIDAATLGDSLLYILDTGNNRVVIFHLPPLTPPTVTVLAPNGGESWFIGTSVNVRWNAVDDHDVASVDLLLSRDGGLNYSALATRLPNTGSYSWTVSPPGSIHCLVRVIGRDPEGGVGSDVSNAQFTITGGPTPTMVVQLSAEPRADGVAVRWQLADAALQAGSWLERADDAAGEFARVNAERTEDARGAVAVDRTVETDRTYWYRVVARSGERQWSFGPVQATAQGSIAEFSLASPSPNPAVERTTLHFELPRDADLRLSLLDVQGRELAAPIHERRPAGRYDVLLDLRDGRSPAPPGLYFVRLQVDGRPPLTRRLVVQR